MEFRKFYGEQLDSHGRRGATRQPRATGSNSTATGDSHGRQPRATGPGDGAGRRGRATGSNSTAQKRGAGITGPFVTIGLADIGDKFVVSAFHAKPRKDRTTDNLVKFVIDVNNLATLIADKIGKIVTIQAKVITLQFVIEGIDGMTLRRVISMRTVAAATTGKSVTNRMIPLDRFNRCNRHFRFPLLRCLFPVTL